MTLERFNQVRDMLLHGQPCDPPMNDTELRTIILFAERWFRLTLDVAEAGRFIQESA